MLGFRDTDLGNTHTIGPSGQALRLSPDQRNTGIYFSKFTNKTLQLQKYFPYKALLMRVPSRQPKQLLQGLHPLADGASGHTPPSSKTKVMNQKPQSLSSQPPLTPPLSRYLRMKRCWSLYCLNVLANAAIKGDRRISTSKAPYKYIQFYKGAYVSARGFHTPVVRC